MSEFHILVAAAFIAILIWSNLYRALRKSSDSGKAARKGPWWNQPAPSVVRRAADIESGGITPAMRLARAAAPHRGTSHGRDAHVTNAVQP